MFVVLGVVGVLLLVGAFLFDDVLDGLLPESDWLSLTAIAAFLSAFGLAGFIVDSRIGLPVALAVAAGTVAGVALSFVAVSWSRSLGSMSTDATPALADLVGLQGRVITEVLPGSSGEVLVRLGGQQVKLTGVVDGDRAEPLARETEVVVVDALSATRVVVQPANEFWGSSNQERKQL